MPLRVYTQLLALRNQEDTDLQVMAILTGMTEDELLHMPLTEYRKLRDRAGFIFYTPEAAPVKESYKMGNWELIPTRPKAMITAQYIDFKEWAKITDRDTTAEMLSALMVPAGRRYNIGYEITDVIEALQELPVTEAAGLRNFFTMQWVELMQSSLTYSAREARKTMSREQRKELQRMMRQVRLLLAGDGCAMWMRWQSLSAARGPWSIA